MSTQSLDLVVHRSAGSWTIQRLDDEFPRAVDLDELLGVIGTAEASGTWFCQARPSVRTGRPLRCEDLIAPAWTISGVAHHGAVLIEDVHGDVLHLDEADLRVLDWLDRPMAARDVCDALRSSLDERAVLAHLGELCASGRIRLLSTDDRASLADRPPTGSSQDDEVDRVDGWSTTESAALVPGSAFDRFRAHATEFGRIAYWSVRDIRPVARVERFTGWCPQPPAGRPSAIDSPVDATSGPPAGVLDVTGDAESVTFTEPTESESHARTNRPRDVGSPGRVPVYAVWHHELGPQLSLGMLTAAARSWDGGRLADEYEVRRPEDADSFLADLETRSTPAVLLCSNYLWSIGPNLEMARRALAVNPALVVVHGGPSCPRYEQDAETFLDENGDIAHVLVRGEGENAVCEVLDALARSSWRVERAALESIPGLTFRDPDSGEVVRTADRERSSTLDELVSPYLSGEFDHLDFPGWVAALETNRGCPYRCSFCDWGSATNSRIRKFDLQRTFAEIEWIAGQGIQAIMLTDANFGILARDVDIAQHIAEVHGRLGAPTYVIWTPAKNTTKHVLRVLEIFQDAGIVSNMSLSMQTFDENTLQAIDRSNISSQHFLELAAEFRRRGVPLQADLMLGLPGQTRLSFSDDLQIMFDQEILPRVWPTVNLPNAPMNAPTYRAEHEIVTDEHRVVMETKQMSSAERAEMLRLRRLFIVVECFGTLRVVLRWLQWDRDIRAVDVMWRILEVCTHHPERYPTLTMLIHQFALDAAPPVGWAALMADVRDFVAAEFDVPPEDPGLCTVLRLQEFLLPQPGRRFPATIELAHDYPAYYSDATRDLARSGRDGRPDRPLAEYGPTSFSVDGDPLDLCGEGVHVIGDSRAELVQSDIWMMSVTAYELDSSLTRWLPEVARRFSPRPSQRRMLEVVAEEA